MRLFRKKPASHPVTYQPPSCSAQPQQPAQAQEPTPQQAGSRPHAGFQVGDMVTASDHEYYEPGHIVAIASLAHSDGSTEPFYEVDFGRFSYHFTADELNHDDGNGVDTRSHPGWLQNQFCRLLTDGVAYDQDGNKIDERWLTGKFYNFGRYLPTRVREQAGLGAHTTYAQAARRLRRQT